MCSVVVHLHPTAVVLVLELGEYLKREGHDHLMASCSVRQRQICVLSDA